MMAQWRTMPNQPGLLVIDDPGGVADAVRRRYPQFDVRVARTGLAGIAMISDVQNLRGIVLGVEPNARKLDRAVAGLRKAAGPHTPLVLCCPPAGEPSAIQAMDAGASDYLIHPPRMEELDHALQLATRDEWVTSSTGEGPTWDEMASFALVMAQLPHGRSAVLRGACDFVQRIMRAPAVRMIAEHDAAQVGDGEVRDGLVEDMVVGGKTVGRVFIAPRHRLPYAAGEVDRLRHYTRLIGHLLDTAEKQEELRSLAMIDELSGLPNRRCLMERLGELLHKADAKRFRVTVLIFDLDGFKHFNDTYGHAAGDDLIRETGALFRRHCRQHDIVARYAGDEFIVVFWDADEPRVSGSKHPNDAIAVLKRFRKALESHQFARLGPDAVGRVTISGGLASFPWDGKTPQELIDRADEALIRAKRDGKNRIYLVGSDTSAVDAAPVEPDTQSGT